MNTVFFKKLLILYTLFCKCFLHILFINVNTIIFRIILPNRRCSYAVRPLEGNKLTTTVKSGITAYYTSGKDLKNKTPK